MDAKHEKFLQDDVAELKLWLEAEVHRLKHRIRELEDWKQQQIKIKTTHEGKD